MGCPGSVKRIERLIRSGRYVEERTNRFAAEGTAAHNIREACLRFGFTPYDFLGMKIGADGFVFEVDIEMCEALIEGLDQIAQYDCDEIVEEHVDTTEWVGPDDDGDPQGGTVDWAGVVWKKKLVVMSDLKYGSGVAVQAVDNKQLRIYLLGLIRRLEALYPDTDFTDWEFLIIIDQPRHGGGGGEWRQTYEQIMEFGEEVRERALETKMKKPPIRPSESACQWCPLAKMDGECPEHEQFLLDILGIDIVDLDADFDEPLALKDPEGITPKRRSYIIKNWPIIKKWGDRLHSDAITDFMAGDPVPGWKVIEGGGRRRAHADEKMSKAYMKKRGIAEENCYTKKLLSPAQAEKELRMRAGTFPKDLLATPEPKPVLVPEDDDRPPLLLKSEYVNLDDDTFDL